MADHNIDRNIYDADESGNTCRMISSADIDNGGYILYVYSGEDNLPRYVTIENGQITYLSIRIYS